MHCIRIELKWCYMITHVNDVKIHYMKVYSLCIAIYIYIYIYI